jgi:hypothetical protein
MIALGLVANLVLGVPAASAEEYVATHGAAPQMVCRSFRLHTTVFTDCYPAKAYFKWRERRTQEERAAGAEYTRICALPEAQRPPHSWPCYNVPGMQDVTPPPDPFARFKP